MGCPHERCAAPRQMPLTRPVNGARLNKLSLAGILTALGAVILLAAELALLRQVRSDSAPVVTVALQPGTTIISKYLPPISWDQRYEITFTNNTGLVAIERGAPGTSCGARELTAILKSKSGTFDLPDFGAQTEFCVTVSGGTPTMVIGTKSFNAP
jgi:hypothetical protein